jgi:Fibronectin type III domain
MILLNCFAAKLPNSPLGFHVVSVSHNRLSLAWESAESNVLHYIIVIREASKKKFKKIAKVDGHQLSCTIDTGFDANQKYVLRVYAENEACSDFNLQSISIATKIQRNMKRAPDS